MAKDKGKHEGKKGKHEKGSKTGGKHRGSGGDNTSDPQTCAHVGHSKTPSGQGGFDRSCSSCGSSWWSPS